MTWPWLALAALGAFHGVNPAMGWLFAVALGLHRGSRRAVLLALGPMALGHALSIWLVAAAVVALGIVVDPAPLRLSAGGALLAWAAYHWLYGHRHRVRFGMTTGLLGLGAWSFLMATSHGAGLMLIPALMPLCAPGKGEGPLVMSVAAAAIHTLAMLAVAGAIALSIYSWADLGFLKRSWINFDVLWTIMLVAAGALLIAL